MSPRGVVDPLLIVLDKPVKSSVMPPVPMPQIPAIPARPSWKPHTAAAIVVTVFMILMLVWLIAARSNQATGKPSPPTRITLPGNFVKNYHGTINDKYAIEMTLRKDGNQLSGQYLYKKYNIPIQIKGTIDGNHQITLYGYDKSGAENDIFEGTLGSNNTFQGQFKTRKEMRAMPFVLIE